MTPEAQRIAIAEACGWIFDSGRKCYQRQGHWCVELPDYLAAVLAKHFGVSETVISGIWSGKRWRQVVPDKVAVSRAAQWTDA